MSLGVRLESTRRPHVVSLFSGAGGLDIGLERAGFHVVAANDFNRDCVATLTLNQSRSIPIPGMGGRAFLADTRIDPRSVEVLGGRDLCRPRAGPGWRPDVLVGGPPCQPFSSAGSQRGVGDPRGRLFEHFARLAAELRPRLILFENVRGLVTARGPSGMPGEVINAVRDEFEQIGYATSFALLNAADFGAPQRRVRLFMFGAARDAALPAFPEPTHGRIPAPLIGRLPWVTLGAFLETVDPPMAGEIVRPSGELAEMLAAVPAGSGLKSPGRPEPTRPGGHWGYKQGTFIADPDLPARTVTGASTQDWLRLPDGSLRRITLREAAGLQGFPPEWQFAGSKASQFLQVGNAVPTVMGEVLGRAMLAALARRVSDAPVSAPFPREMIAAITYTHRDDARNGGVRPRSPRFSMAGVDERP